MFRFLGFLNLIATIVVGINMLSYSTLNLDAIPYFLSSLCATVVCFKFCSMNEKIDSLEEEIKKLKK